MLKSLLGEMSTLVVTGQKAFPRKLLDHGYVFAFPKLEEALRDMTR
jgi:NAD dependent epimerase/dehydratase family enzyme